MMMKKTNSKHIGLVKNDNWLEPFEDAIRGRHDHAVWKLGQLTTNISTQTISHMKTDN